MGKYGKGMEKKVIPEVRVCSVIQEKVDYFGVPIDCSLMYQMLVGKIETLKSVTIPKYLG